MKNIESLNIKSCIIKTIEEMEKVSSLFVVYVH